MLAHKLHIIKLGSAIVDDPARLSYNLKHFFLLPEPKILVHGGGKLATTLSKQLGLVPQFIDGRRVTDQETLDVAIMVYAGLINKKIVSELNSLGGQSLGLCGADLRLIVSSKRRPMPIDFGWVGDVRQINVEVFKQFFDLGWLPVLSAITWDPDYGLLNTNADSLTSHLANGLGKNYAVSLQMVSESVGVLFNHDDPASIIPTLTPDLYAELKSSGVISGGMIPKLDGAFSSLQAGIKEIWIAGEVVGAGGLSTGTKISLS